MGAGAIGGLNACLDDPLIPGQGSRSDGLTPQSHRNIPPVEMECEGCSIRFSLLKRKKLCGDCGRQFCSACSMKVTRALRRCSKCQVILTGDFTKQDLLPLKVKDLRFFLTKKNINIRTCTEKGHLVDLIFLNFANATHQNVQREHEQHVGRLAERMREAINEERQYRAEQQRRQQEATTPTDDDIPAPPTNESEEERSERLRERQEREMRETLNRLAEELQENENNQENRQANVRAKLSDIETEEDIEALSVKQLKEVLATNFVDYKGCCEKYELAERVQRLWRENQSDVKRAEEIKTGDDSTEPLPKSGEDEICKICMDAAIECVLLECGHMVTCTKCGRRLAECPICRQNVVRVVRIFRA